MANNKYSIELKEIAYELYEKGLYAKDIASQIDVHVGTVTMWLRNNKLTRSRGPKTKISNVEYFDVIDTEEKAYYLGWIMADGNVSIYNGQYSLKIHICIDDRELIDNFLEAIGSTNKTKIKEGKNASYYVSLTSRHMIESLIKLGVVPNKTGKEYIPNIDTKLIPHFIRGYFDGDGITCVKQQSNYSGLRSGFVGSEKIIDDIQKQLCTDYKVHFNNGAYYFLGGREFSRKLYEYLYYNSNIYLKRKFDRMNIICGNTEVSN